MISRSSIIANDPLYQRAKAIYDELIELEYTPGQIVAVTHYMGVITRREEVKLLREDAERLCATVAKEKLQELQSAKAVI